MKMKKEMKISKASIVFYVAAVIFLAIAAFEIPCLEVSTMKLSDEFNLLADESPCFSGLFFFEII